MSDYRYPFITAKEPEEKLKQIESYLRQLVDKLNVESSAPTSTRVVGTGTSAAQSTPASFDEIKSFLIKSGDVVDSLYESVSRKLSGAYVAQSEFGQYRELTAATLEATDEELKTTVERIEAVESADGDFRDEIRQSVSAVEQTADGLEISVTKIINDGVDKVTTETGYTFNADGLRIQKPGETIENLLNNEGMRVSRSGDVMLQANSSGVVATDVKVRNYLIVGTHARFENYPGGRTACFYVTEEDGNG